MKQEKAHHYQRDYISLDIYTDQRGAEGKEPLPTEGVAPLQRYALEIPLRYRTSTIGQKG